MVIFTNDMGMEVNIPEDKVKTIEQTPNYDVIQARHNPSGQVLTKVVYRNPVRRNIGGMSPFNEESELLREGMPEVDDDVQVGRENPRYNGHCMNPSCPGCSSCRRVNPHPNCTCDVMGAGECPIHGGSPSMGTSSRAFHGLDPQETVSGNPHPDCTCDIIGFTGPCPIHGGSPSMGKSSRAFHGLDPQETVSGNPSGSVISWRNLRLSAAIMSSKQQALGRTVATIRRIPSLGMELAAGKVSVNKSIRNIPELLPLATAEHWFDYIRNMNAIDVGAELSAEVSPQEQLAVYHFLKEWEMDPSHRAFRNRVNNSADIDSELTKGQIVYDIMTSRGPNPMKSADFSKHRYDKMFKLAMDILGSIRLNTYNYYTINRLHTQEGDRVFMDFRSRYVPLSAQEVSMVTEMQSNISDSRSYAFQTTSSETQALEADQLMRKAVSSYQVGDTRTTKSILDVLMAAPFGYTPLNERITASHVRSSETTGEAKFQAGEVFRVQVGGGEKFNSIPEKFKDGNSIFVTTSDGKGKMTDFANNEGKLKAADSAKNTSLIVLDGFHSRKPVGILQPAGKGKGATWSFSNYDAFMKKGTKTFEDKRQRDRSKRLQDAVKPKKNPKYSVSKKGDPKKRGKFLFMEIHHKNRLDMKRKASGQHGSSKNTAKWSKGLNKVFPGMQLVQTGILKSTGEEAPYRIRLPTTHFKRVTHPTTGKPTIGIKKGDAKLKKVWQDLLDTYGMPKHTPDKGTHHRYIIPVGQQGSYQAEVRRKVGKAKAKR